MVKRILVTTALPYANGELHLGHILEFIQADIWVNYHKLFGNICLHFSGCDSHGTPIMLKSYKNGIFPERLINNYRLAHKNDLMNFGIYHDNFYTTHSYENEDLSRRIFYRLVELDFVYNCYIDQLFDCEQNIFLPDRYVIGVCPNCHALDQNGDVCEYCSYRYNSVDLLNPISVISNTVPIKRISRHWFFSLKKFKFFLNLWCFKNLSQVEIKNKLTEWFNVGLKDWDISRDYPYFGFKIPNEYSKYFYVWLDAPIGYMSSFRNYFITNYLFFDYFFTSNIEYYHFIGKDILYFHTLFWPAILHGVFLKLPKDVFVHGFLTINGRKMSKSNNTFITAKKFSDLFEIDYLRYYFASKLTSNIVDVDFNYSDFFNKVNTDFIGKFINIFLRCSKFLIKNNNAKLTSNLIDFFMFNEYIELHEVFLKFYETRDYNRIILNVLKYANKINLYLEKEKPWQLIKDVKVKNRAFDVCTLCLNLFLVLLSFIKPIVPSVTKRIEYLFCKTDVLNSICKKPVLNCKLKTYTFLISKISKSDL